MEHAEITIIGAGITGLAIAAAVSKDADFVYVLEKHDSFGRQTSSRNSEVIHSGIYYPQDSLKAKTCVEGNRLLYEICRRHNIKYKKWGKLIVAAGKEEVGRLGQLLQNGRQNGVEGLTILDEQELKRIEPNVRAPAALYSPQTGVIDSYALMRHLWRQARAQGAEFVFRSEATKIDRQGSGYEITICDADGSSFSFSTQILINCAGLDSDCIARVAGINVAAADYRLKFCKGEYFRVGPAKSRLIKHLIYPVPDSVSLGIHATPDLQGSLRLGPDAQYIDKNNLDYNVDNLKKEIFSQAVDRFLPFIASADLSADIAGIRPKLQGPGEDFRDFVICHEEAKGLPGLINLIGIDSPGLTAAVSIAKYVRDIVKKLISA